MMRERPCAYAMLYATWHACIHEHAYAMLTLHYATWHSPPSGRETTLNYPDGPDIITKSRELSPTGSRREARESQCMRRIQCTTAAWRQTGPPDKGCGWPLEVESSSWPTAKKMGSWVLQPERTGFHHQHEWPWKQIFSLSLQIKGQSSWNLTVDLWSPEHRTRPSSPHCWPSELVTTY